MPSLQPDLPISRAQHVTHGNPGRGLWPPGAGANLAVCSNEHWGLPRRAFRPCRSWAGTQRCSVLATSWAPQRPMLRAWQHPGRGHPRVARSRHPIGAPTLWRGPTRPAKTYCGTPSKRTVVFRNGNSKRLVGLSMLPELLQVLLQLAKGLLGNVPGVVGLVEAAGQHLGPLSVMGLRVLWINGGVHLAVQPRRMLPG